MNKKIKIKQEDLEVDFKKIKDVNSVELIKDTLIIDFEMKE